MNSFANSSVLEHLRRGSLVCTIVVLVGLSPGAEGTSAAPSFRLDDGSAKVSRSEGLAFDVTYSANLRSEPTKGRVYVFLGPDQSGLEPRLGPQWFRPQPFFAVNVENWKPGEPLRIDSQADGVPGRSRRAQSRPVCHPGRGPAQPRHAPDRRWRRKRLRTGRPCPARPEGRGCRCPQGRPHRRAAPVRVRPSESSWSSCKSEKLSAFFHRADQAPRGGDPAQRDAQGGQRRASCRRSTSSPGLAATTPWPRSSWTRLGWRFGKDFIRVLLDPDCGTGHHVFADSATNGPRGTALVEEFIPHIERTFPAIADPRARLLNGHSSGGWSSLWLQVTYPDFFGGTWSTSPDPVDFRDFQRINIYAPGENMFRDRAGKRRPIARMGKRSRTLFTTVSPGWTT